MKVSPTTGLDDSDMGFLLQPLEELQCHAAAWHCQETEREGCGHSAQTKWCNITTR